VFIKRTTRRVGPKTYVNHLLVESVATPAGPRHRTICSLGSLAPGPIDSKSLDETSIDLGDKYGPAVGTPEGEIARHLPLQGNLAHQISVRGDNRHRAVAGARHRNPAVQVIVTHRPKYGCRACEGAVVQAAGTLPVGSPTRASSPDMKKRAPWCMIRASIFDWHRCSLAQRWQHGMRGIAHQRDALRTPITKRIAVKESPFEALVYAIKQYSVSPLASAGRIPGQFVIFGL
jgi:hypothetical protein